MSKSPLPKLAFAFAKEAAEFFGYEHPDISEGGCADVSEMIVEAGNRIGLHMHVVYGWARPNNGEPTPHAWLNIYGRRLDPTWTIQEIRGTDYREDPRVGTRQLKPAFCEVGLTRRKWQGLIEELLADPAIRRIAASVP